MTGRAGSPSPFALTSQHVTFLEATRQHQTASQGYALGYGCQTPDCTLGAEEALRKRFGLFLKTRILA